MTKAGGNAGFLFFWGAAAVSTPPSSAVMERVVLVVFLRSRRSNKHSWLWVPAFAGTTIESAQ
ncbi:MAG: hypothetical protein ABI561_00390 [Bradyrhizobium sp.]